MTTKTRWLVGAPAVAAVLAVSAGFAVARDGGTPQVPGGMMGGTSIGTGMMGSGPTVGGMMDAGMASMMSGVDMEAMHEQMMAALAGKVPSDILARCDALHDRMWSAAGGADGAGHGAHHGNVGSTG
jgi:hypothetical protein